MDAVVAGIEEEDRREAAARRAQQEATRDYVQSFVEEQHRLKQRRQQQQDAEDARQAQLPDHVSASCTWHQMAVAKQLHLLPALCSLCIAYCVALHMC